MVRDLACPTDQPSDLPTKRFRPLVGQLADRERGMMAGIRVFMTTVVVVVAVAMSGEVHL